MAKNHAVGRIVPLALATLAAEILTGCAIAPRYTVEYDSVPQSALLVCDGRQLGYTPIRLSVRLPNPEEASKVSAGSSAPGGRTSQNVLELSSCEAVWSSGARAKYPSRVDMAAHPGGIRFGVERKEDAGVNDDIKFDLEVKKERERRREAMEMIRLRELERRMMYDMMLPIGCYNLGGFIYCDRAFDYD